MAVTKGTVTGGKNLNVIESWVRFTRPANTTAYAAKDAVADKTSAATVLNFENLTPAVGGAIRIREASVLMSNAATTAGMKLWLFSKSPTAINDNAAFALSDADSELVVATFNMPDSGSDTATNNWRVSAEFDKYITLDKSDRDLYGLLEITETYTPASAEVIKVIIRGYSL